MNEFENQLLQTTIAYLIEWNLHDIASLLVESELNVIYDSNSYGFEHCLEEIIIDLPISTYNIVEKSDRYKNAISRALNKIAHKHIVGSDFPVVFRIKLIALEENWKEKVKELISNFKEPNQGVITEKIFLRDGKVPILYNEMKFGSKSEIRIAEELEEKKVLFFPLPLAVRSDTGIAYRDHREPDFLICLNGTWGILEVSYHPDRYEKDSEKDTWFKQSGILCVQHYTSERCYNSPKEVVTEFLDILEKYKK